jgi:hypothetical protein
MLHPFQDFSKISLEKREILEGGGIGTAKWSIRIRKSKRIPSIFLVSPPRDLRNRLHDNNREHALQILDLIYLLQVEIEDLLEDCSVEAECDFVV